MSECVFALIRLNLINDRKEMGGEKDAGSRGRKARRTEGGRAMGQVSEAENMVVRNAVQQPFFRKYHALQAGRVYSGGRVCFWHPSEANRSISNK